MARHKESFDKMFDVLIDDILEATDEEIINETVEDGVDIESEYISFKNIFEKSRYDIAKRKINEKSKVDCSNNIKHIDINAARKRLNSALDNNSDLRERFTMAARLGENIPDEDVMGYYEDFCELDLFNDDEIVEDK